MQKRDFGIWRNRQPHGANPTAFLSGEDLGIPSGDVGIPTQSPAELLAPILSGALAFIAFELQIACPRLRRRRDYSTIGVESGSIETPYPPVKTPAEVKGCRDRLVDFAQLCMHLAPHYSPAAWRVSEPQSEASRRVLVLGPPSLRIKNRDYLQFCVDFCALPKLTRSASFNHLITHIT